MHAQKEVPERSLSQASHTDEHTDPDGDGLYGPADQCPFSPEDIDGFEDMDGCPDPDNDQDGIGDAKDKCPREPETFNNRRDQDGCPDGKAESQLFSLDKGKLMLRDPKSSFFRGKSIRLSPTGRRALQQIASLLKTCPQLQELTIWALDDPTHAKGALKHLSWRRSKVVAAYLRRRGIRSKRVVQGRRAEDYLKQSSPARDLQTPGEISLEITKGLDVHTYIKAKMLEHQGSDKSFPDKRPRGQDGSWPPRAKTLMLYVPNGYKNGLDMSTQESPMAIKRR